LRENEGDSELGETMPFKENVSTAAAVEALQRGYTAVPIQDGAKRPHGFRWQHTRWNDAAQVTSSFDGWAKEGAHGVGLLLGAPSGGLIDVDLDHPKALRLRDIFLPPTAMVTGHAGRPRSHHWYRVLADDPKDLPSTRNYKMPPKLGQGTGDMIVELRSTGAQTVIPPSIHPSQEPYRWEGEPWGGEAGPHIMPGRQLEVQVALLAMGAVLLDNWPDKGSRHEAYLALAGGLLRYGKGVHPYWERNLPVVIEGLAVATRDSDGPRARVTEVMHTTLERLREVDGKATGFPKLAELIGVDHAEQTRRLAKEATQLGWRPTPEERPEGQILIDMGAAALVSTLPPEERNPLVERINSWGSVDLEPYLSGQVVMPEPAFLFREDGKALIYPGRVNSLFGRSESAKSWIALYACVQEMAKGGRVIYIDFEDGPEGTVQRLKLLGAGDDDLNNQFRYIVPETPLADMQHGRYITPDDVGRAAKAVFDALVKSFNPTLIVADGMTVLYGLHGQDTNDAAATEVITGWLKRLCRTESKATVIVIDHTGKGEAKGASPIGAHHKIAMVQGTALRVDLIDQPMPGKVGSVRLIVFKDRPGSVRRISSKDKEQVAGIVNLDSTVEGITRMWIDPPKDGDVVLADSDSMDRKMEQLGFDSELQEKMLSLFDSDTPERRVTSEQVWEALPELSGHPNTTQEFKSRVRDAWDALVERQKVKRFGRSRHTYYQLPDKS
jgi:hypothetical protein